MDKISKYRGSYQLKQNKCGGSSQSHIHVIYEIVISN